MRADLLEIARILTSIPSVSPDPHSEITEFFSREDSSSMKTDYIAENILVSILAVNGWTVGRVFPLTERFSAVGLLDFAAISGLPIEDIAERLARAGYSRGECMNLLLAARVLSMATVLTASELKRLKQCLVEGRTTDVSGTLRGIKGVEPVVLERSGACKTQIKVRTRERDPRL